MSAPIRKVVVAGSGPVAWTAAAGLVRAMRKRELEVTVVDTAADDAPVGYWTLPSQRGIQSLLGINESHFVQGTGTTFRLASEHVGWQGAGSRYLHAHGDIGRDLGGMPFYRYLQSEAMAGRAARPENFSVAGTAARMGRFARPMGKDLTASFTYGFHVEAMPYTRYLRSHAEQLGVRHGHAPLAEVETHDGAISALRLEDGSRVEGDLFLDCTGSAAHLLRRISDGARDDWSAWLPCDRMLSAIGPAMTNAAAMTQTIAAESGWGWRAPLAERSMVGFVYSSQHLGDDAALQALNAIEPALRGEPLLTRFASGRRRHFWVRNCVALGNAAVELEPLVGASLHIAHLGLATLVELFPRDCNSTIEAAEYNRLVSEHADALRDFTIAHYRSSRAQAGPFWTACLAEPPPARLVHKLDLYGANGRIVLLDHETFEEVDWAWLLLGSGVLPSALELQARDAIAKLSPSEVAAMRARVQQVADSMPTHAEFVRRQIAPTAPTN